MDIKNNVIFLGNGRCYHTLDWYRSAQAISPETPPIFITDLIEGESFQKLLTHNDKVELLFLLDRLLLKKQSRTGNLWRNLLKLLLAPLQVVLLRKILSVYENPVIHAHSMYYIFLARFSGARYVATPQGSEILVRPFRSKRYLAFSRIALSNASAITVDSVLMQRKIHELYQKKAEVVQNGINLSAINEVKKTDQNRNKVVSVRALDANYQINRILEARNLTLKELPISFCYPFIEESFKNSLNNMWHTNDEDLGRLDRVDLYHLLLSSKLVISIPVSDSSPRSVYEAIFCGCFVATTPSKWIHDLPKCMRSRIIETDLSSPTWLLDVVSFADQHSAIEFHPSEEALELFDQQASMLKIHTQIYPRI